MHVSDLLNEKSIDLTMTAMSKDEAIAHMVDLMAAAGTVQDREGLVAAARAREDQGTTGLGDGIAIPHGKTDAATRPGLAYAYCADGIDWGAPDGTSAHIIFLIAVPEAAAGDEHLRILAQLSRRLVRQDFRDRLTGATSPAQVREVMAEIDG